MKEKIIELHNKGYTYRQIKAELGCSLGTICYHIGAGQKQKYNDRLRETRRRAHPYVKKLQTFSNKTKKSKPPRVPKLDYKKLIYDKLRCYENYCGVENMNITVEDLITKVGENPICYLTGKEINIYQPRTYQLDHKIPRSRGGDNTLENLGIATSQANDSKRNMTPDEYIHLCKQVLEHNGYKVDKL